MKKFIMLIFCLLLYKLTWAQINIALLHQLVSESKSEHSLQSRARDNQAASTLAEEFHSASMGSLKNTYREIRSRFSLLGNAAAFLQTGLEARPLIGEIHQGESELIGLCSDDPALIPLVAVAQADLARRAEMLLRFLYGIILSTGDLGQMSQSGRRLLFAHVINELRSIHGSLKGLCLVARAAKEKYQLKKSPFSGFVDRDRSLIENILQRVKTLKN